MIVNTSDVAKKLLKNGKLQRRIVFLPLDKMASRSVTPGELRAAQSLVGKEHVFRAIDLVDFEPDLAPAIEFILGGVLVCTDLNVANKLAFDRNVAKLCVTLEGDKVNPSGELSGGKKNVFRSSA